MIAQKLCRKCLETMPVFEFYAMSAAPDGRQYECRHCFKQRSKERRERLRRERDLARFSEF